MAKSVKAEVLQDIVKATNAVKRQGKFRSIHSVYSGFWSYEKQKHDLSSDELKGILEALVADKAIFQHGSKGGYQIYLYADRPQTTVGGASKFEALLK